MTAPSTQYFFIHSYVVTEQEESSESGQGIGMGLMLVVPMDVRIPKIRVRTRHSKQLYDQRLVVAIDEWDADSMYPTGHIVRQLGVIGELETEIQGKCTLLPILSAPLMFNRVYDQQSLSKTNSPRLLSHSQLAL